MISKLKSWELLNRIMSNNQIADMFHPKEKVATNTKLNKIVYIKVVESNFNLVIRTTKLSTDMLKEIKRKLQTLYDSGFEFSEFPRFNLIITSNNRVFLSYYQIDEILSTHEALDMREQYKQRVRGWVLSILGENIKISKGLDMPFLRNEDFKLTDFEQTVEKETHSVVFCRNWFADEEVIVKFNNQDDVFYECKVLLSMNHPNIVRCFGIVYSEKFGYGLVLEYCARLSLASLTDEPFDTKVKWIKQIISVVQYIHAKGYVHLALEPGNVLVDSQQNAKLIDFTLARRLPVQESLFKKINYASSEQIAGDIRSTKTDNYSLALVIYFLLVRLVPFDEILQKSNDKRWLFYHLRHMKCRPHIPHEFEVSNPKLSYIMRDMWREKPNKRLSLKVAVQLLSGDYDRNLVEDTRVEASSESIDRGRETDY